MAARIRRLVAVLARTANWRCADCDTFNGTADPVCICCGGTSRR
jgi:hypothetical protein